MKVTLLVPTLNEIEGMKTFMPQVKREWVDQILIIDGQSTDGTAEYARKQGYEVVVQKEKGMRHAYREAFEHVRGDVVLTFSPDGNSIPELIPKCIEKMKEGNYDMVIVSRYTGGAKSYDDSFITGIGNRIFTMMINALHGGHYTDALVMYRAYKTKLFKELDLDKDESYAFEEKLFHTRIGVEPLLSVRAAKRKLKCGDIPGDEPAREGGVAKLQIIRWGLAYMFQVWRELFIWR